MTRVEYDALGNVTKQSSYADAYPATDSTSVSALNAAFATPPVTTRATEFAYDTAGRLVETTDAGGYKTRLTLDAAGQVTSSTAAHGVSGQERSRT